MARTKGDCCPVFCGPAVWLRLEDRVIRGVSSRKQMGGRLEKWLSSCTVHYWKEWMISSPTVWMATFGSSGTRWKYAKMISTTVPQSMQRPCCLDKWLSISCFDTLPNHYWIAITLGYQMYSCNSWQSLNMFCMISSLNRLHTMSSVRQLLLKALCATGM